MYHAYRDYVGFDDNRNPQLFWIGEEDGDTTEKIRKLFHLLGRGNEHQRHDRDEYINVFWENIIPGMKDSFIDFKTSSMYTIT